MSIRPNPLLERVNFKQVYHLLIELAPYLKGVRREFVFALLCSIGAVLMQVVRPWPIKMVFDYALLPVDRIKWTFPYALMKGSGAMGVVSISCGLLLAISVLWGMFNYLQRYMIASAGQHMTFSLRRRLFSHLQALALSFHRRQHVGDLILRATADANMMREMLVDATLVVFTQSLVLLTMVVVMAYMDLQLTFISIAVLPLLTLSVFRISSGLRGAVRKQRKHEGRMASHLGEMLQGIAVIQAFGREAHEEEKFRKWNRRNLRSGLTTVRLEANLERMAEIIVAVGTGAVLWFGTAKVLAGVLTPGDLLVFNAYLAGMYRPLRRIARITGRISKAQICADRVLSILRIDEKVKVRSDARPAGALAGRVSLKDVSFSYRKGVPILTNVSFTAKPGYTVAIVGPNGAGKSTLCGLLPRLYDPDSGSITIDRVKINQFTLESLRENIGIVMQHNMLFAGTIAENIAYGKLDADDEEIEAAARAAEVHDFIVSCPDGYQTLVGERGDTLSSGQQQKIGIARAMIKDPSILILDEPTASLDASSARLLNRTLLRVSKDRTTFRVSHRIDEVCSANLILVIIGGCISQQGRHAELMSQAGWYRDVFAAQSSLAPGAHTDQVMPTAVDDVDGGQDGGKVASGGSQPRLVAG